MTGPSDTQDPLSRITAVAAAIILLLIFLTPAVGFWWLTEMATEAVERNSLDHSRDMLFRHVARTGGGWPESWNDLAPDFEPADAGYGTPNLDALKDTVNIDFRFDLPSAVRDYNTSSAPPRIIWLSDQPDTADVRRANARLIQALHRW